MLIRIVTIDHANSTMTYSNEWCKMGIDPEIGTITEVPLNTFLSGLNK